MFRSLYTQSKLLRQAVALPYVTKAVNIIAGT